MQSRHLQQRMPVPRRLSLLMRQSSQAIRFVSMQHSTSASSELLEPIPRPLIRSSSGSKLFDARERAALARHLARAKAAAAAAAPCTTTPEKATASSQHQKVQQRQQQLSEDMLNAAQEDVRA